MRASAPLSASLRVDPLDEDKALSLLAQAPDASWRQFPAYASVAANAVGAESRYVLVSQGDGEPIGLANLRIKPLPLLPMGIAMIAQGPVMLAQGGISSGAVIAALQQQFAARQRLTLRINPPVTLGTPFETPAIFSEVDGKGYETFLIDIAPDEEALRAKLNGKWRTDLRRGERGDVQITRSSDPEDFRKFQPLLTDLAKAKGFTAPQDAEFFAKVAAKAAAPEKIAIHLAWHEGRLVGGHIGAFSGNMAVYLLGATNDEGRSLRASFLLQWAVIGYAKELGIGLYDLGGTDEADNPDVFRFKKRMGGQHYMGPAMVEAQAGWPSGAIVKYAERLYSRLRG